MTAAVDLAGAALEYAERGWPVFPLHSPKERGCSCGRLKCKSPGKHPRTERGLKDASCDPAVIREWWTRWPDANIGILTGSESDILVLDIDGKRGEESLVELATQGYTLPNSHTVQTGGGGRHIYFLWPGGAEIRNSQSRIALGLDIRGQCGYVVAPPSLHAIGSRYELTDSSLPPMRCPEWLLSLIQDVKGAPPAGCIAGEPVEEFSRTNHLVSLAGTMNKRSMEPAAIEAALLAENTAKFATWQKGPLPEIKVRAIARDIPARYPNSKPNQEEIAHLKPQLVCLGDIEPRAIDWLWEPFIPLRMLSMVSGDPGAGKSFVALSIAADLSHGKLRDGRTVEPATTLYLTIENPTAEVMRPRFDSLGGDPNRLHLFSDTVSLANVDALEAAITEIHAQLIVVDPLQSYLGANVDLHRSNETRPVMDRLAKLADKHCCAILLLRHLSKQGGGKPTYRGLGSIDLTGAVRSEVLAGSLPDDPEARALVHIKSNVGRIGNTLGYSIDGEGRFAWTGESSLTAADLLAAPTGSSDRKLAEATRWLSKELKTGNREQRELQEMAEQAGITYATLRRAKDALHVRSHKEGMGGPWLWSLPEGAHDFPEDAQEIV